VNRALCVAIAVPALLVGSAVSAAAVPAPPKGASNTCANYGYFKQLSPTRLRVTGGVNCKADQIITLAITVEVNGKVVYVKGSKSSDCSYRHCSFGYTAVDWRGTQHFEVLVESRTQPPKPIGTWAGHVYKATFYHQYT
jgi:hypothetical protein